VSGFNLDPSIRYSARLATDPLGTMGLGETSILEGTGAESSGDRWGDYSGMTVDPADGCTFWYVNEYYGNDSDYLWQTRIAHFNLPGCGDA
jgi:hypothetical protein